MKVNIKMSKSGGLDKQKAKKCIRDIHHETCRKSNTSLNNMGTECLANYRTVCCIKKMTFSLY